MNVELVTKVPGRASKVSLPEELPAIKPPTYSYADDQLAILLLHYFTTSLLDYGQGVENVL